MNVKPVVEWQAPDVIPKVAKGKSKTFWVVVERVHLNDTFVSVFDAQYVNMPLIYEGSDDDEPQGDYLTDDHGDPIEAVGWYSNTAHSEFDSYYEPLVDRESERILAWGEYQTPDFNLEDC